MFLKARSQLELALSSTSSTDIGQDEFQLAMTNFSLYWLRKFPGTLSNLPYPHFTLKVLCCEDAWNVKTVQWISSVIPDIAEDIKFTETLFKRHQSLPLSLLSEQQKIYTALSFRGSGFPSALSSGYSSSNTASKDAYKKK